MKYILLLTFSFNAFSQYQLEDVLHTQQVIEEVSQEETNQVETINSEEIEQNLVNSLDDVLKLTSGATTTKGPRSSAEAPQIRGIDANKISISLDGVVQNYAEGHSSMIPIDTENIKAVKVTKNNSDLSMTNTICGGVEFKSKDPEDYLKPNKENGTQLKLGYNSAAQEKIVSGKTAFKNKNLSGYLSLTSTEAKELSLSNGTKLANSSYRDLGFFTKFKVKDFRVSFENFRREDDSPVDPTLDPETEYKDLLSDAILTKNTLNLTYENKQRLMAQAYINSYKTVRIRRDNDLKKTREIETTGFKINKDFRVLSLGLQTIQDKLDSNYQDKSLNSYPKAQSNSISAYIDGHFSLGRSYFMPGIKVDSYTMKADDNALETKSADKISKKFEYIYRFSDKFRTKLSYTEGFNAPTVREVYPNGLHRPEIDFLFKPNFFIPNTDLTHEESQIKEAELSYTTNIFQSDDQLKLNISYYENNVKDYIQLEMIDAFFFEEADFGTTKFVNIPKARLYGHDISISYLYDIFEVGLDYSQVRGRNLTESLFLQDLPADFYTLSLKSYIDKYDLVLGYSITETQKQDRVNPETTQSTLESKGYTTQDLFANKRWGDFELGIKVNNLGNKKYIKHTSRIYESSEDIRVALKYKINTY